MARELPDFNPYLDRVMRLLGCHLDGMADAMIEAEHPTGASVITHMLDTSQWEGNP
jgi:hypothetical protein